jgi:hypothetical protein
LYVETDLLDEPAAFVRTTRNADGTAAFDPGDLSDDAAHRPGRPGHQHGLARLGPADIEQAEVRGQTADTEGAQMHGCRCHGGVDCVDAVAVGPRIALHAEYPGHVVADGESGMA